MLPVKHHNRGGIAINKAWNKAGHTSNNALVHTTAFSSVGNANGFITRRVQSTALSITSGQNTAVQIKQPGNMQLIVGVSMQITDSTTANATTVTLSVNGQKYLDAVCASELIPSLNYHPKGLLFVPILIQLAGNDAIQLDINGGGSSAGYFTIYYKSNLDVPEQYNW
jgi:hypothetical protein